MGGEQLRTLLLQGQILRPEPLDRRDRVLPPAQGLGHDAPHGAPELLLDLLQAGNLPINALPPGRRLGRPALLVLLEPLQRLPHHLAVICHVPAPLPFHKLLQGAVLFLRGLRLVILLHLPKRPQTLLIPAAQDAV